MSYSKKIKLSARNMRKKGDSIIEIAKKLKIAKSTISLWVKDIELPEELKKYLTENSLKGSEKGMRIIKAKREIAKKNIHQQAKKIIQKINLDDKNFQKICAAIIFWCEGTKRNLSSLCFTNSDPEMIKTFLFCLRSGFDIDEKKFRALLHLHEYHEEKKQINFWSKITNIPSNQFHKSYRKTNTKIRQRENYQGCLSLRYFDSNIARKLDAIYHTFAKNIDRPFV